MSKNKKQQPAKTRQTTTTPKHQICKKHVCHQSTQHAKAPPRKPETKQAIAANPNTPVETLTALANDAVEQVRKGATSKPNTTTQALEEELSKPADDQGATHTLTQLLEEPPH